MEGRRKGLWSFEEDRILMDYIKLHGKGKWNHVAKMTGLKRCGKSCRLRWINYLSPSVKRDDFSEEEDDLIIRLHKLLGNRWALIAGRIPGRTDNQVKNHWNIHLSKKIGKHELNKTKRNSTFHHRDSLRLKPLTFNNTTTLIDNREKSQYVNPQCIDDDVESENQMRVMEKVTNIQGMTSANWNETSFLFLDDYPNFSSPNFFHVLHQDTLDFLL